MAVKLPNDVSKSLKKIIFARADEFGYGSRSRVENGAFLNALAEDPEIGGRLRDYMPANAVRTYIKDGVLNAYAKAEVRKKLNHVTIETVIKSVFMTDAAAVGKVNSTYIYRNSANDIFLVQSGTYLKWETALRKLLECVASNDQIETQANSVKLCLVLAVSAGEMSFGDQQQLEKALSYIGVRVYFAK